MHAAFLLGFSDCHNVHCLKLAGRQLMVPCHFMGMDMQVMVSSEVLSSILNCVCPDCG
jgi:hypothetical protein